MLIIIDFTHMDIISLSRPACVCVWVCSVFVYIHSHIYSLAANSNHDCTGASTYRPSAGLYLYICVYDEYRYVLVPDNWQSDSARLVSNMFHIDDTIYLCIYKLVIY